MSARAAWTASGEGEQLWFLGTLATIRIPGAAVDGRFSLVEILFPEGASPPLHTHPQDESYIVLEGRLTVVAGSERFELEPGGAAVVPIGVPHTFRVDSDGARVLMLSTPSGIEDMIRALSVPAQAATLPPPDAPRPPPDDMLRLFAEHGQQVLGPALGPED